MARQGDLQLTQYDERGWQATFYTTRPELSPTSATRVSAWVWFGRLVLLSLAQNLTPNRVR
jgi:hypothetical protein